MTFVKFGLKHLFNYNIHLGYHKSRWNPEVSVFLFGIRNNIHIFNLTHTLYMLRRVTFFISEVIFSFGILLCVNNKLGLVPYLGRSFAKYGQFSISGKYIGGSLTNFRNNRKCYLSLRNLFRLPSSVFVGDLSSAIPLIFECRRLDIPLIGVCDSNVDPSYFTYPIPGNSESSVSLKFYYKLIFQAIYRGILKRRLIIKGKSNV